MKLRVISALVIVLVLVPMLLLGGVIFNLGTIILALLALRELLKVSQTKKELPMFINFISYIVLTLIIFSSVNISDMTFAIDFRILSALALVFLVPVVLYHDRKKYDIISAFYLLGGVFFLGISFSLVIILRNISLLLVIYLFLITVITDSYAYIIGSLIGKHKLLEMISPNKTWEGMIFGTVFGTIVATTFYVIAIDSTSIITPFLITLFLSILGQFGDLVFSAIKRHYGVKDFSNIIPGHGGILDRFDSIIFVMLGYIFFI